MPLELVTPAINEPVSLAEAKLHCRVDIDDDDALIEALIQTARDKVEKSTGLALMSSTWDLWLDDFPCGEIQFTKPPVTAITWLKYTDGAGVLQTLAADQYTSDLKSKYTRIVPGYGLTWPSARCAMNAVNVRFVAGYADAVAVPASIRSAMLLWIGHLYANRESVIVGTISAALPMGVKDLLSPYVFRERV